MTWGVWWAWTATGWQVCFSASSVAMVFFAKLFRPSPRLDLSDEALAAFIDATKADTKLWERS